MLKRGEHVLRFEAHALGDRGRAGAHIGRAVYCDQAVRTASAAAEQATRAMVFEGAAEQAYSRRIGSRGHRVTREGADRLAGEVDGDGAWPVKRWGCHL